ncbi:MAG: hypothetical protein Q8M15_10375 [Bacteroidota bacterium]|nr:hypothetical protein [Bacteroidota bacterium]
MNSLQLVSKIKSKADDINQNIRQILDPGLSLTSIEKELLKKQCLDLYELLMKLKSESDELEEKLAAKLPLAEIQKPLEKPLSDLPKNIESIRVENTVITEKPLQVDSFKEVMSWAEHHEETLDSIEQKVELNIEAHIEIENETISDTKIQNTEPSIDINFEKALENKRIQYTVMPDSDNNRNEEAKPAILNAVLIEKEISYNERIAQKIQANPVPLADKTIEAPIDNLKTAINLNKKIAFVNELFKENVVEYAKAIDKMNNAEDRTYALQIFNELKQFYQWQHSNELVQELEKMVKRRYM